MSTDGSGRAPLTRAQLRALRAEEETAPDATVESVAVPDATVESVAAPDTTVESVAVPDAAAATEPVSATEPEPAPEPTASDTTPDPAPIRRFRLTMLAVLGALVLVVVVLGVISLTQGPRLSAVQVDAAQVLQVSGSRIILTANQRLEPVRADQVSVEPAVPFTVDAGGRSVGIRFTVPLRDDTDYRVRVAGVSASGGGPRSDLTATISTPASRILLLQRDTGGDDTIFVSDLGGEKATPVFRHPRIADFRATSDLLVVSVEDDDGSRLLTMRLDGSAPRELTLPGQGWVSALQVSDRGGLVGYSYSDRELSEDSGRASVLVTQSLNGTGEPRIVEVGGAEASIDDWQFVPDSSSVLFIDFDGALGVEDPTSVEGVATMGIAADILGIGRGTFTAIVQRADGAVVELDLTSGDEQPLPASEPDYGDAASIEPFPGGTLRHVVQRDEAGMPTGQAVVRVDDDGAATVIAEVGGADAIVQTCASPSGQYAAVVIAPDLPSNDYDDLQPALPTTLHTRLIDLAGERELPSLDGFDISWCRTAPRP